MRVPEVLLPLPRTAVPTPLAPLPPANPLPQPPAGDSLQLSADGAALARGDVSNPGVLREVLVSGLLRILVGESALPADLRVLALAAARPESAAPPAVPMPGSGPSDTEPGDLTLRFTLPLLNPDGARLTLHAELVLHPALIRAAPPLVAALMQALSDPGAELPPLQLAQLPAPQLLGFQLATSPAALWPVMLFIASGQLRLSASADAEPVAAERDEDTETDTADETQSPGERFSRWLALHRARFARR